MQSPPPDDTTTVSYLDLENFRRFERLQCHLESDLTVLVAENGGGKTAVLDGLAVGHRPVVEGLRRSPTRTGTVPSAAVVSALP